MTGVKLLMPGYDFAQKNSELQAVLGVDKQSPEMHALRKQARQLDIELDDTDGMRSGKWR